MELNQVRVRNFRSYRDSGWVDVGDKTLLVGENNAGKSNLLRAIKLLFNISSNSSHNIEDSHRHNGEKIIIEGIFTSFTPKEKEALEEHVIDNKFRLRAEFPFNKDGSARSKQLIVQQEAPENDDLDPGELEKTDADKVVEIYRKYEQTLKQYQVEDWDGEYKKYIIPTVERYLEEGNPDLVERNRSDPRGLRKKLKQHLPDFRYFEANRDIESETKTTTTALLGQLLNAAIEETSEEQKQEVRNSLTNAHEILNKEEKFNEIEQLEKRLKRKLNEQIPLNNLSIRIEVPNLEEILSNVQVEIDDGVKTGIMDMGAGIHTAFILSCLRELSELNEDSSNVIFALEEPENDLHPHAQRQLYDTLNKLTDQNHQVVISTHSAHLVSRDDLFDIQRVEKYKNASRVHTPEEIDLGEKQIEKLKRRIDATNNELFFSKVVLLGEGPTEDWVLPTFNSLYDRKNNGIYAFDRLGISQLTVSGKPGMKPLLRITNAFNIPSIALIDDDSARDDGHEGFRKEIEEMATEVVELPDDIETELFHSITLQQFYEVMEAAADDFSKDLEDLRRMADKGDWTEPNVMRRQFEDHEIPKPLFGKLLANKVDGGDLPGELVDLMELCRTTAIPTEP